MTIFNLDQGEHCVAFFVSPHGFGHAARAASVIESMQDINNSLRVEIFTKVPQWFFRQSISREFGYHSLLTDIGLVQKSPLIDDVPATVSSLNNFIPFDKALVQSISSQLRENGCDLVICDISPLGIAVAKEAQIASVLVENFTWDWIYKKYSQIDQRFNKHIDYLKSLFLSVDYHIQTEPVCCYSEKADFISLPISRKVRTSSKVIHERLAVSEDAKLVLITMGGFSGQYTFLDKLKAVKNIDFLIPGDVQHASNCGNLHLLPKNSSFFHPDLVNACDLVIGKAGYSTVAEVYYAGVPFGYVTRENFQESDIMGTYITEKMFGLPISETEFQDSRWTDKLNELLTFPRVERDENNGSMDTAKFICGL